MQFLSGLDGTDGMGMYFETPQMWDAGTRFQIEGSPGAYTALPPGSARRGPPDGMGRYFEDSFGIRHGDRFEIQGANERYMAPRWGGVNGLGSDASGFEAPWTQNKFLMLGLGMAAGLLAGKLAWK